MNIYKMHALDNDFVIILNNALQDEYIKKICDRKNGVGCDQLLICDTESYNVQIYNNDGSRAGMCLNGLRCLGYLFYFEELKHEVTFNVYGKKVHTKYISDNSVQLLVDKPKIVTEKYNLSKIDFHGLVMKEVVDIGNLHLVLLFDYNISKDILKHAEFIKNAGIFKDGVNISFAHVLDSHFIKSYVEERGAGFTKACGSAAASIFYITYTNRMVFNNATVIQEGGDLNMALCNKNTLISQIGEANLVFKGDLLI